ncbi:MAG: class I SAM-dependent methyltransferase [Halobacteriales archaeon]
MDDPVEVNRRHWDELAALHPSTEAYDVEGFLDGGSTITWLEREGVGAVDGLDLLHLQCHFGLDTLSWLREGADTVAGVDFSSVAIDQARDLAEEAGLADRATFVESDLYDLPDRLDRQFDVVFTSFGVINWLPDIEGWATVAAQYVRPGGWLFVADLHPISHVFFELEPDGDGVLRSDWPYFTEDPQAFDEDGSYADYEADVEHTETREWSHDLGSVVTSLIDAGLRLESLEEHPFACFEQFPGQMRQRDDGFWEIEGEDYPLTFSLSARKPPVA